MQKRIRSMLSGSSLSVKKQRQILKDVDEEIDMAEGYRMGAEILAEAFRTCTYDEPAAPGVRKDIDPTNFSLYYLGRRRQDRNRDSTIYKFTLSYCAVEFYSMSCDYQNDTDPEIEVNWEILYDLVYGELYDMLTFIGYLSHDDFSHDLLVPLFPVEDMDQDRAIRPSEERNYEYFCYRVIHGYRFEIKNDRDEYTLKSYVTHDGFDTLIKAMQKYGIVVQDEILDALAKDREAKAERAARLASKNWMNNPWLGSCTREISGSEGGTSGTVSLSGWMNDSCFVPLVRK